MQSSLKLGMPHSESGFPQPCLKGARALTAEYQLETHGKARRCLVTPLEGSSFTPKSVSFLLSRADVLLSGKRSDNTGRVGNLVPPLFIGL